ncbi:P-loop containing nucleoside triphosphate hydrolase protein [Coniochaeta sp. 2T2.1]|nr:P-loop containing nucleoside triphosphate hydrolase protein [Coniochaeta sp. 2T2.1]
MLDPAGPLPATLRELQAGQEDLFGALGDWDSEVGGFEHLPQIVVVGNHYSGKSSVLQAISGIRFPSEDGLGTQVAIQLSLRRAIFPAIHVSREKDGVFYDEPELSKTSDFTDDDIVTITKRARQNMACRTGEHTVFDEVLHVQISGPKIYPLTLVDLPGFSRHPATKDELAIVDKLADRYMANPSSIILAVMSARFSIAPRNVLERARKHDPQWQRTLGILNKVNYVEGDVLQLGKNTDPAYTLGLGWHVLRLHTGNEAGLTDNERHAREESIFQFSKAWRDFPTTSRGVKALRQRLSETLYERVQKKLPEHIQRLRTHLNKRMAELQELGPERTTPQDLRQYLTKAAKDFERLANDAINGHYVDAFFVTPGSSAAISGADGMHTRPLRAVVHDLNSVFYETMMNKGHSRDIYSCEPVEEGPHPSVKDLLHRYATSDPSHVEPDAIRRSIGERAKVKEVTTSSQSVYEALVIEEFDLQSSKWKSIAVRHIKVVLEIAKSFVANLLIHNFAKDRQSYHNVMAQVVEPFFETRRLALKAKLEELTRQRRFGRRHILEPLSREHIEPASSQGYVCSDDLLNQMLAYYDESIATFINNIVILAIENCLVSELPSILDPSAVGRMEDIKIARLVTEQPDIREVREHLESEIALLRNSLNVCERHLPMTPLSRKIPSDDVHVCRD